MFDFAWSEFGLIAVVALVLIGPKDLPIAIKSVAGMIKKARRMAGEFQTHVDEMVREADLGEVRDQIKQIRNFDFRGQIEKAVDEDGSLRKAFQDPFSSGQASSSAGEPVTVDERPETVIGDPEPGAAAAIAHEPDMPAFIPPGTRRGLDLPPPPSFVPPRVAASMPDPRA
jgi:sec-independent protein translocase protein TatB